MKSEIRKDYIQEKYVLIAPKRGKRPRRRTVSCGKKTKSCHFCPSKINERLVDWQGKKNDWTMAVLKNKYPAVSPTNPKAYGYQEVVIETPDHEKHLEQLSLKQIRDLFEVYARRTMELQKDKKIDYILIFKNSGGPAGASLVHAHSQIFATKFLPPHLKDKAERVKKYQREKGRCVYCDVIKKERKSPRFVFEDDNVICFTPYASTHNYEVWILPKRHLDNVAELNPDEQKSWAHMLKKVLKQINKLKLPYNFYFHQVVSESDQHLYMKITPRGSVWAGVEIGSGLIINAVSPEQAAQYYRQVF